MGEERNLHRVLVGKFEGKSQPSRPRHGCVVYVKLDITSDRMKGRGLE